MCWMAPVYFLHVSSSGGSSMCRWAQQQRCARIPSCGANCNLPCAHPWDWRSRCRPPACEAPSRVCTPPFKAGCKALARYVQRHNLSFFASETVLLREPLAPARLCPMFRHVAVLRQPVERARRQLERMSQQPNSRFRAMLSSPLFFNTSERTSLMGTPALNNYITRLVLGPQAFFLPLNAITDSHCDDATRILAGFDAVVPLEHLERGGSQYLAALLGWTGLPPHHNMHRHKNRTHQNGRRLTPRTPALSERNVRKLYDLNRCDMRLYEQAVRLLAARMRAMKSSSSTSRNHELMCPLTRSRPQCPMDERWS